MKIQLILIAIFFFSCNKRNEINEYYSNGELKMKSIFDESDIKRRKVILYYKNGNLKADAQLLNNKKDDSLISYFENGTIREKAFYKNDFPVGWAETYYKNGRLKEKNEFIIRNDSFYLNQKIAFKKSGVIDTLKSSFFEIMLPDTLKIGRNIGLLKKYIPSLKGSNNLEIKIFVENEYDDGEIKIDSFSGNISNPWFGIYSKKAGNQSIKIKILEQYFNITKDIKDTLEMVETRSEKHFTTNIVVTEVGSVKRDSIHDLIFK